jgi:hypothetical protein
VDASAPASLAITELPLASCADRTFFQALSGVDLSSFSAMQTVVLIFLQAPCWATALQALCCSVGAFVRTELYAVKARGALV